MVGLTLGRRELKTDWKIGTREKIQTILSRNFIGKERWRESTVKRDFIF